MEIETKDNMNSTELADDFSVKDWVQDTDGKWILTEEARARSLALYYSGRLAYSREDSRIAVGRYNSVGEVIPFKRWVNE